MKDELIRKILVELNTEFNFDFASLERLLVVCFADYEVKKKETAIIPMNDLIKNEELIKQFIFTKLTEGKSKKSLQYYAMVLNNVFDKIGKPVVDIKTDDIRYYLALRQTKDGISQTSADNERRVLNSFYSWAVGEEKLTKNPVSRLQVIKGTKKVKRAFSELEVEKLRASCDTNREKALIEILLSTACRASEVSELRIEWIKDNAAKIVGKGNKERIVYFNAKAQVALRRYLSERKDGNPYVFPGIMCTISEIKGCSKDEWYTKGKYVSTAEPISTGTLNGIVKRIGKRAGVENVHLHRFRRTAATMALKHGMPVEQVSKMLGHSQLTTTQIYLDLSEDMLREAHRKYLGG